MTVKNQDISIVEGDSVTIQITVTGTTGGALDLSGGTNKWGFAREWSDAPVVTVTSTNITISSTDNNVANIPLPSTATVGRAGKWKHELAHKDSSSNQRTFTRGILTIDRQLIAST